MGLSITFRKLGLTEQVIKFSYVVKLANTILARERDKGEARSRNADQTVTKLSFRFES